MFILQRKNIWNLLIFFVFFTLAIKFALGIRINEVSAKTPEFVEIYNEGEINLSEFLIKDDSTNKPDEITCWNIENCSLYTSASYFIIIGRNTNISEITSEPVVYFYVDDSSIGNGINDNGDNITFFNSSFSVSFYYESSTANKSWQFCDVWVEKEFSAGRENNCYSDRENQSDEGQNNESSRGQNQSNEIEEAKKKPILVLDVKEVKSREFELNVRAEYCEDGKYDLKIEIIDRNGRISEIYDEGWKSSFYYINSGLIVIDGVGERTVKLRITKEDYDGTATIFGKIRKGNNIVFSENYSVNINFSYDKEEIENKSENKSYEIKQDSINKTAQITGKAIEKIEVNEKKIDKKILIVILLMTVIAGLIYKIWVLKKSSEPKGIEYYR